MVYCHGSIKMLLPGYFLKFTRHWGVGAAAVPVSQYDQLPAKVEFNYADPAAGFVDSSVLEEEVLVHGAVNKKSQKQLYREPGSVEQ